jgi:hypothetical protein
MYLNAKFYNFCQGDLSISDFYHKMKKMSNALGDLNEHVSACVLMLGILWP